MKSWVRINVTVPRIDTGREATFEYVWSFASAPMHSLVTTNTKCYQIGFVVIAQSAPRLNMVDLKILHAPARLATPAISLQNFTAEPAISFLIKH
jgi:hypothetical protein